MAERESRLELESAYAIELSSVSEMNNALQLTMESLETNAVESARELQAAKKEKEELMRQLKSLAESNRRAEVDADVSKKLKESEAEKAALLKILEDIAAAERRAETQRLIQLQVQKSELANRRAMDTLAKLKEPARYIPRYFSDAGYINLIL